MILSSSIAHPFLWAILDWTRRFIINDKHFERERESLPTTNLINVVLPTTG